MTPTTEYWPFVNKTESWKHFTFQGNINLRQLKVSVIYGSQEYLEDMRVEWSVEEYPMFHHPILKHSWYKMDGTHVGTLRESWSKGSGVWVLGELIGNKGTVYDPVECKLIEGATDASSPNKCFNTEYRENSTKIDHPNHWQAKTIHAGEEWGAYENTVRTGLIEAWVENGQIVEGTQHGKALFNYVHCRHIGLVDMYAVVLETGMGHRWYRMFNQPAIEEEPIEEEPEEDHTLAPIPDNTIVFIYRIIPDSLIRVLRLNRGYSRADTARILGGGVDRSGNVGRDKIEIKAGCLSDGSKASDQSTGHNGGFAIDFLYPMIGEKIDWNRFIELVLGSETYRKQHYPDYRIQFIIDHSFYSEYDTFVKLNFINDKDTLKKIVTFMSGHANHCHFQIYL